MFIIFDSNIWFSELALNSNLGAAVRFFIRKNGAKVVVPEVVRLETEHNLRNRMTEFIENIRNNHRQLLTVFGRLKEVVLPEPSAVEEKIASIFNGLGVEIIAIPFSFESARRSFLKTVRKEPPSHNNQQFKDGVLWADCVELLKQDDVILVSSDKAFYAKMDYSSGLAQNLKAEIIASKHAIKLIPTLSDLLKEIRTEVKVDKDTLEAQFREQFKQTIEGTLERNNFGINERKQVILTLYVTEQPSRLYIEFQIEYECVDLSGESRTDGLLTLRGVGRYDALTGAFSDLHDQGESLSFTPSEGCQKVVQSRVVGVGSIVLGHKEVAHAVMHHLID